MKKLILLVLPLLLSCGMENRPEATPTNPLPPPIPPIYAPNPTPRPPSQNPKPPATTKLPTHAQVLTHIRRQYPQIVFQEIAGNNAYAEYDRYTRRPTVKIGTGLKYSLSSTGYALVVLHEVTHLTNPRRNPRGMSSERWADYYAAQRLYWLYRNNRYRHDKPYLKREARKNIRHLEKMNRGNRRRGRKNYTHDTPDCRETIYDAALDNKPMPTCATHFMED